MSVLGAIVNFYDNGVTAEVVALRTLLGVGRLYADRLPDMVQPFVILGEESTSVKAEPALGRSRPSVRDIVVSFSVFTANRQTTEAVLDALEAAYYDKDLTITGATKIGIYFEDRTSVWDSDSWLGTLVLRYRITKAAA